MEEKKDCGHGDCCNDKKENCCCCHHCCRHGGGGHLLLKIILYIIVFGIIINLVFSLLGFDHGFLERGEYRGRGYMMDYRYGPILDLNTGGIVLPPATNGAITTPPVSN